MTFLKSKTILWNAGFWRRGLVFHFGDKWTFFLLSLVKLWGLKIFKNFLKGWHSPISLQMLKALCFLNCFLIGFEVCLLPGREYMLGTLSLLKSQWMGRPQTQMGGGRHLRLLSSWMDMWSNWLLNIDVYAYKFVLISALVRKTYLQRAMINAETHQWWTYWP